MLTLTKPKQQITSTLTPRFKSVIDGQAKGSDNLEGEHGEDRLPSVRTREYSGVLTNVPSPSSRTTMTEQTENESKDRLEVTPLIRLKAKDPDRVFEMHQHFEGLVVETHNDNSFTAELSDLTDRDMPKEVADFSLAEISEDDHTLVRPGAIFYWSMGIERSKGGQVRRVSEIRLRRLPVRSRSAFERAIQEGRKMFEQVKNAAEPSSNRA
jgi:hypothetical protein